MSFILQVFHAPDVRTIDEAGEATDRLGSASRADRLRFIRFILELTARYPNRFDEPGKSPWPEGLVPDRLGDAVLVFAVNLDWLEENLMLHVADCAAAQRLHVLDPQNGILYRGDRMRVRLDGSVSPLPEPRRVIPEAPSQERAEDFTPAACIERLGALLGERLAHAGFAPDPQGKDPRRTLGSVQQSLEINAIPRAEELLLFGNAGLRCRPVTKALLDALGGDGARLVNEQAAAGWPKADIRLLVPWGDGEASAEAAALSKLAYVTDWRFATAWLERWAAWVEDEGLGHLARMESPAGIGSYALSRRELEMMGRRTDLSSWEVLHRVVLACRFGGPLREEWLRALRRHCDASTAVLVDRLVGRLDASPPITPA